MNNGLRLIFPARLLNHALSPQTKQADLKTRTAQRPFGHFPGRRVCPCARPDQPDARDAGRAPFNKIPTCYLHLRKLARQGVERNRRRGMKTTHNAHIQSKAAWRRLPTNHRLTSHFLSHEKLRGSTRRRARIHLDWKARLLPSRTLNPLMFRIGSRLREASPSNFLSSTLGHPKRTAARCPFVLRASFGLPSTRFALRRGKWVIGCFVIAPYTPSPQMTAAILTTTARRSEMRPPPRPEPVYHLRLCGAPAMFARNSRRSGGGMADALG